MKTEILLAPARALAFCATVLVFSVCISRAPVWAQENLAQRYENTAKEMLVKVEEQKKRLQHYDDKSYLYGREGQDFQSHALALLRKYERAAEEAGRAGLLRRQRRRCDEAFGCSGSEREPILRKSGRNMPTG